MSHASEQATRLDLQAFSLTELSQLAPLQSSSPDVWLLRFPFWRTSADWLDGQPQVVAALTQFLGGLPHGAVVALLSSPEDIANVYTRVAAQARYQLWVAVELEKAADFKDRLAYQHAALLILSKYDSPLRHVKTRIAYTYCPYCDKTTKDYGGKKHTYHAYGTLMSDVWRDVRISPRGSAAPVIDRLRDVFGLDPHRALRDCDLSQIKELRPSASSQAQPALSSVTSDAGDSRLIRNDCLQALSELPANSIDFCFADPPYNLDKRYDRWDDNIDSVQYFEWCDHWLAQLARILKPGATCAVLNIPQWTIRHIEFLASQLQFQNWIAWEGLSLPVRMIMPAHYAIACFSKGPARPLPYRQRRDLSELESEAILALKPDFCLRANCLKTRRAERIADRVEPNDLWWDLHRLKHNSRRVEHPCQLPAKLMQRLISIFTYPGEMVVDPFNGAGTTSLCAEMLGRRFIGIELSSEYHELAERRHCRLRQCEDPFAKTARVPQSKNSRVKRIGGRSYSVRKKVLQLEVKAIAQKLGRLPTRADVAELSEHPISMFDDYFISWGEVCAAARTTGMSENRPSARGRETATQQLSLFHE